jgi:hypothetical protein
MDGVMMSPPWVHHTALQGIALRQTSPGVETHAQIYKK